MNNVLSITTSLFGDQGVSSRLLTDLLAGLKEKNSDLQVTERDFSSQPVPHVDGDWLDALMTPEENRTAEQTAKVGFSDTLIEEVKTADLLLIALPMYNFSVPSMLKSWIDHVARAGSTFKYTENGPVGLLAGKKVYFLVAMGGFHEAGNTDFLRPFMTQIMNFMGITDVEFISAEGLNMGEELKVKGMQVASNRIQEIIDQFEVKPLGAAA